MTAGRRRGRGLNAPVSVATDAAGAVYIVDQGINDVRRVSPDGIITRIAGNGRMCAAPPRCGDGGLATAARLSSPVGVAVDATGNVYIADYFDDEVRRVTPDGMITRFAGSGQSCLPSDGGQCGDGGLATPARLSDPTGVAIDAAGDVLIVDSNNHEVREVSPQGTIARLAGNGDVCVPIRACGDGGPTTRAVISTPWGIAVAPSGDVYITDILSNDVWKIALSGRIDRVAGTGRKCAHATRCGDGGDARAAEFNEPSAVAVGGDGRVYIADTGDLAYPSRPNRHSAPAGWRVGEIAPPGNGALR